MADSSIFTRILAGDIPGEVLHETDRVFVLRDIAPKAPVHLLVIPKTPMYVDVVALAAAEPDLLAEMIQVASLMATEHADGDFRLVFNTGAGAGQTVPHVHAHMMATPHAGGLTEGSLGDA
jgi:histidine triad (HIT) family protein